MQKLKYFLLIVIFYSCNKKNVSAYTFDKVKIDSKIKNDLVFDWLDNQKDFIMYYGDPERKKSSIAIYYSKWKDELEIPPTYFYNNCRAYFFNDTLVIRIGTTTFLSDSGIMVKYKNGKYSGVPFKTFDIVDDKPNVRDTFFLRNRKLVLDKYNYKLGDSIFGRIHLEVEEPMRKKRIMEHFSDGFFRAKIVKAEEL